FQAEDGIRDFHVTGVQTCALPISLRLGGSEPERALLARNLERNRLLGYQGDRDEVHDVAVQDQAPGLAALALFRMMQEERGERAVGRPRLVELVAGAEIAAQVQVRYGEQVVRSLRERPHPLPHPAEPHR